MENNFSPDKYLTDKIVLESTLIQIEKDFRQSGIEIQIGAESYITFDYLAMLLKKEVANLLSKKNEALFNLLYRIDISEIQIKRESTKTPEKEFELLLSEMIIKRELQKVVIREYYKQHNPESQE